MSETASMTPSTTGPRTMSATRRYVNLSVVLVFAVITGVLVYQGRTPPSNAAAGAPGAPGSTATPRTAAPPAHQATNLPMRKLKAGEKAPQLVIFSFDGAGDHDKWQQFMAAAKPTDSRFNGFLTGTYLLTDENKAKYTGPGHAAGKSSVGFGGTAADLRTRITDLNAAYAAGHEIGLHYNGHFCAGAEPSAAAWRTADWNSEIGSFFGFLKNYRTNNPQAKNLPALKVPATSIKGGRTPCLEGQWDQLVPAWKKAGFTYDTSMNAPTSGISWPKVVDGIWEFYMPYVYSPGFDGMVVNMDYNMWVKFNGGANDPSSAPVLRDKVYQTYQHLYDSTWKGNRAPLLIANHFNTWNGNSFNPSVLKFMTNYCGRKDTYCTTYSDAIAWMKLQDPKVLAALQAQPAVASEKP